MLTAVCAMILTSILYTHKIEQLKEERLEIFEYGWQTGHASAVSPMNDTVSVNQVYERDSLDFIYLDNLKQTQ